MSDTVAIDNNKAGQGQFTERVMKLIEIMTALVDKGKRTGVTSADWSPLAELVAVDEFERVGPFHDAVNWAGYTQLLSHWVNHAQGWDPIVKRITEVPGLVYVQCEEMITNGDRVDPFYSLSLYEFNDAGKIRRIEVYMQQEAAESH